MNHTDKPSSLISVVIPAYKARNFLAQSLESAAGQALPPLEILVIDDCSPEPIDDIIESHVKQYPEAVVRVIRHEKNQGLGAARNTGIKHAQGELIALLDHDDLWAPNHLESLLSTMFGNNSDMAFCTAKHFRDSINDDMGYWGPTARELSGNLAFSLFKRCFITPSATLVKKDLLLKHGCFNTDPNVHMCEDFDLWQTFLKNGAVISHAPEVTCYYRKHPDAATSKKGYMSYQTAYVTDKWSSVVEGNWYTKQAIVARRWWLAFITFVNLGQYRWDVFSRAFRRGLLAPVENSRGIVRFLRVYAIRARLAKPRKY